MPFKIIRNDITKVKADAIVNTANPLPVIGGGTDSAIYKAAGEKKLLAERIKIGKIAPGQCAVTPAFKLRAKYLIHTVAPVWIDGKHGESDILRLCYENSLNTANELSCESIVFPLIATGIYAFPKSEALNIALSEIGKFLLSHEMDVTLAVLDRESLELSENLIGDIEKYIDEHCVKRIFKSEYGGNKPVNRRSAEGAYVLNRCEECIDTGPREYISEEPELSVPAAPSINSFSDISGKTLDEVLNQKEDSFRLRLFKLIDERGLDDVTVYKRANIDRKVFSRIRCKEDYKPKKTTAVAFAVALRLDMPATLDLLSRAEIAFSPGSKFDLIVSYFILNRNYDIYEINAALFKYGQPLLGE
ncbi:MAG: macro domain-containing protein [Clostridiales bacterium]|nr:macro domain-containing protein [Clostridiales bacterium]